MNNFLSILKTRKLKSVEFNLSSTYGIKDLEQDNSKIELLLFLEFEICSLSIYNEFELIGSRKVVGELAGEILFDVIEGIESIDFVFGNGDIIRVNMTEEGYRGPEAMHLLCENGIRVVWN